MQRLDHIDLLSELSKLKNKKILPKKQALLKAKKLGLDEIQDNFAVTLENEMDLYRNSPRTTSDFSKIQEDIYIFLDDLRNKKFCFINENFSEQLNPIMKSAQGFIINRIRLGTLSERLYLTKLNLLFIVLLHTDFWDYRENKLSDISFTNYILDIVNKYCELLLESKKYAELEKLLKLEKELLLFLNTTLKNRLPGLLSRHYILSTEFAFQKADYPKARRLAFKCIKMSDRAGGIINHKLPILFKECSQKAYSQKLYLDAILFATLGIEAIISTEIFLQNKGNDYFAQFGVITDVDSWKQGLKNDTKYLELIVSESKKKLLESKREILSMLPEHLDKKVSIEWFSDNKFSILIQENNLNLKILVHQLNRSSIICYFDPALNQILFGSLLDINMELFKKILSQWFSQIEINKRLQAITEILSHAEVLDTKESHITETIESNKTTTEPEPETKKETGKEPEIKQNKKQKVAKVEILSTTDTLAPHQKVGITWGDNYPKYSKNDKGGVYPLYGQTAHNQYLFINHHFFHQLNFENPEAARTLVTICERGKVINSSQGNKGIIIEGNKVKIKDTSKSYRFFGQVVASTTHKDKTCQLIEIDTWHKNPH